MVEAFIGSDFEHIWNYKEFQASPQGEWVDLDIDSRHLDAQEDQRAFHFARLTRGLR